MGGRYTHPTTGKQVRNGPALSLFLPQALCGGRGLHSCNIDAGGKVAKMQPMGYPEPGNRPPRNTPAGKAQLDPIISTCV